MSSTLCLIRHVKNVNCKQKPTYWGLSSLNIPRPVASAPSCSHFLWSATTKATRAVLCFLYSYPLASAHLSTNCILTIRWTLTMSWCASERQYYVIQMECPFGWWLILNGLSLQKLQVRHVILIMPLIVRTFRINKGFGGCEDWARGWSSVRLSWDCRGPRPRRLVQACHWLASNSPGFEKNFPHDKQGLVWYSQLSVDAL